jgi:hypothetical protein
MFSIEKLLLNNLKIEAAGSSETLVRTCQTVQHHFPKGSKFQNK